MKFNANKNEYLYLQIGTGRFWKQCQSLTDIERVSISEQIEYVLFYANGWNAEIIYLLYLDHRDLEGLKGPIQANIYLLFKNEMNKYGIFRNRYFSSLEGNQCKKYRRNWKKISEHLSSSKYVGENIFNHVTKILPNIYKWKEQ